MAAAPSETPRAKGDRVKIDRTDAEPAKPAQTTLQELDGCLAALIAQHLGVSEAGAVIDHHMDEVPPVAATCMPIADDPLARRGEAPPQLLDLAVNAVLGRQAAVPPARRRLSRSR